MISYDAYTTDGIKRLEDKGVTDCIVGFRVPYIKGPDTEPLETKIKHLEQYAETVIAKVNPMSEAYGFTKVLSDAIAEAEELIANAPFIRTEADRLEGYDYLSGRIRMAMQTAFDYDLEQPLFVNPTHQFSKPGPRQPGRRLLQRLPPRGGRVRRTRSSRHVRRPVLPGDGRRLHGDLRGDQPDGVRRPRARHRRRRDVRVHLRRRARCEDDDRARGLQRLGARGARDAHHRAAGHPRQAAQAADPRAAAEEVRRRRPLADRVDPDLVRLPPVLPVQGAGQHVDRAAVDARRPGLAVLLDRPLRAGRGRGDDRLGAAVRRLHLPGDPDRVGLVRLDRLRDPPDVADQGAVVHRRRRPDAVRHLRAPAARRRADRQLAGDHRPPHRPDHAALAAPRARPHRGRRPHGAGRQDRRRTRPCSRTCCR